MIAVDTNIIVYAHRSDTTWHGAAYTALASLSDADWAIPWPCIHEFIAIVTHPKVFDPPTPLEDATAAVESWLASHLVLLGETEVHWTTLQDLLANGKVVGPQVHDARIAAICVQHAIEELWSADRDFGKYPALRVRNPLVAGGPRASR
jgi:toxin-antitoxin system PIN domain toxin